MSREGQKRSEAHVERFREALGPFVVGTERTHMPVAFTNAVEPGHRIVFVNNSFLALTGYRRDEVIGQPFPAFLVGATDAAAIALINGQFDGPAAPLEVECQRRDGGRVQVELRVTPVSDRGGGVVQHAVSLVDLSAETQRRNSESEALHVLYQQAPDFIAITQGPDHRFTFVNTAYEETVGPRELVGRTVREAFPEMTTQEMCTMRDEVYRTGKPYIASGLASWFQRKAGGDLELRYVDLIYQPIEASDGAITGIFCEGHDVTEERALFDRVQALQVDLVHLTRLSAMGTMAATLAHEMTQPLAAIANYTETCKLLNAVPGGDREEIASALDEIANCVRRGADIIRQLRELTERRKTRRDHFRLKDAVTESVALVRAAGCAGTSIVDSSSAQIEIDADRTQIQQILINLVRNGCEAAAETPGGGVTVSAAVEADRVVVRVQDTGSGVSPEASKTLFKWADSTKPHGTGIGLSICRTLVEAHGGDLWLEDSGHAGSCFAFSLPVPNAGRWAASA